MPVRIVPSRLLLIFPAAVFLLLLPALYNGFPLVTSDSGAYINNGFELYVPLDRPLSYSIFLRLCNAPFGLWGAVIVQALLLAFFLYVLSRHFLGRQYRDLHFLGLCLLLSFATPCGWFCSQLMPDIFTGILLLAVLTWYCVPLPKKWQRPALLLFIFCVAMQHNSHALVLVLFGASALLAAFVWKKKKISHRSSVAMLSVGAACLLAFSTMNAIAGRAFRPSSSANIFLMGRLVETGILDRFLAENCLNNEYSLCAWRDRLPLHSWDFIWDGNSPLNQSGTWQEHEEEYGRIIRKIMTKPRYLGMFLQRSANATVRELPMMQAGDGLFPLGEGYNPYWKIMQRYPFELKEYLASQQNTGQLSFGFFNGVIYLFFFLLSATVLYTGGRSGAASLAGWRRPLALILWFLLLNAATTASLSAVIGRYQARVIWVLPFFGMLYLLKTTAEKKPAGEPGEAA